MSQQASIRQRLYGGSASPLRRYAELVTGEFSFLKLLKYELITTLFGPFPGALGLWLRRRFYPLLLGSCGKGTIFGRSVVIRNGDRVYLGDGVVIDDNCVLDGRGAGEGGLRIGDRVVVNRGASIQAKLGAIHIGSQSDIGSGTSINSYGLTHIGEAVTMGGCCHVGGGTRQLAMLREHPDEAGNDSTLAAYNTLYSRGPIRIEDGCVLGGGVMVLDACRVGARSVIGAGVVVREDVPADSVLIPAQKLVAVPRRQFTALPGEDTTEPSAIVAPSAAAGPARGSNGGRREEERIAQVVFHSLEQVNERLPPEIRIRRSLGAWLSKPRGPLDSLGLVNLIVAIEEGIETELGRSVNLVEEDPASREELPFATVGSLVAHLRTVLSSA